MELAEELLSLGRRARAETGARDVALFKRLKASTRLAELVGRFTLHIAATPWLWGLGALSLAYHLAVEAQLNHSVMHGAYLGLPGAEQLTPNRYETLAVPFQTKTWRDAHRIHHAHPSTLAWDPDTLHPLFRVHPARRWRVWHRFSVALGALFTFETWAFDYDAFLKQRGLRSPGDRGERRKFFVYLGYQLVLFPALARGHWGQVLLGGLFAILVRNVIFTGLQTSSSVGHAVSTLHARAATRRGKDAWYRFQIETSKNFAIRRLRTICGGLDRHIEHHLYPGLPPNRLHLLSAEVRAICERHGVRYQEFASFGDSLRDSFSYLEELSRRSSPSRDLSA